MKKNGFKGWIIVGGIHASHHYEYLLKYAPIDFVVIGEGEKSFPSLLKTLENKGNLKNVLGIAYEEDGIIYRNAPPSLMNFDNEIPPMPYFDLVPPNKYNTFSLESSRGCYGNCTFCSIIYRKCWRGLKPEIVLNQLQQSYNILETKMPSKNMFFADDCFTTDRNRTIAILKGMKYLGFDKLQFQVEAFII